MGACAGARGCMGRLRLHGAAACRRAALTHRGLPARPSWRHQLQTAGVKVAARAHGRSALGLLTRWRKQQQRRAGCIKLRAGSALCRQCIWCCAPLAPRRARRRAAPAPTSSQAARSRGHRRRRWGARRGPGLAAGAGALVCGLQNARSTRTRCSKQRTSASAAGERRAPRRGPQPACTKPARAQEHPRSRTLTTSLVSCS